MIDLTPLDVRKKRGDFRKVMRGYDPEEVDTFLEVVAERMETLVRESRRLQERAERLQKEVDSQEGRAEAVREALVTAQELRSDIRTQAQREADLVRREAEAEAERILDEARRKVEGQRSALEDLERARLRFLRSFRGVLQRQLDALEVEESRDPMEDLPLEIDFRASDVGGGDRDLEGEGDESADAGSDAGGGGEDLRPFRPGFPRSRGAGSAGDEAAHSADGVASAPEEAEGSEEEEDTETEEESLWLSSILDDESDEREGDRWP